MSANAAAPARQTDPPVCLTTPQLAAATGATWRQIQWWTEHNLLRCARPIHYGPGGRVFNRYELVIASVLVRLEPFRLARKRVVAEFRAEGIAPPFYVLTDRTGRRVRLVRDTAEVIALSLAWRGGVVVIEVEK